MAWPAQTAPPYLQGQVGSAPDNDTIKGHLLSRTHQHVLTNGHVRRRHLQMEQHTTIQHVDFACLTVQCDAVGLTICRG
jgi:hypothetical protein